MSPTTDPPKNVAICFFPGRESSYSRTRTIRKGMEKAGIRVFDCSSPQKNFGRYWHGFTQFWKFRNQADIIFVGFFGHLIVPLVKIFTRKKIIFDAFVSVYLTLVTDRKTISSQSVFAFFARFIDRYACQLANKVFIDTVSQMKYMVSEYALDTNKFAVLRPGSDETVMYPRPSVQADDFIVHFHGEFQTLHGTEYIIRAAQLLPDIAFQMIGEGPYLALCQDLAQKNNIKNVIFIKPISYEDLPEYIAKSSVCLGIFGNTLKAQSVIPHKVFEAMAMAKPIITADTPATRELLTHNENVYFCESANPQSLANAIRLLKDNPALRKRIAENAYKVFQEKCSLQVIGNQIRECASELLRPSK